MKKKFGHYEVVSELGRGGMGVVYKAWEPSLNRHVAIKVLGDHLLGDEALIERFTREAKAMAAINHPNVIQVYFIGMEGKQPFFAMEFIEGVSLDEMLRGNKALSVGHAKEILRQACQGLAVAHDTGLVHRDIKPANLMVCSDGTIKVVDFGIAQTREYGDKLTNTGEFVGTPGYLSPEVCTGKEVDARSDIFALGIVFYEMLAGKVPFENDSPLGLMLEVVQSDIPDIREVNRKVDRKTSYILQKMIAKNPQERFQDCNEIVKQLGPSNNVTLSITAIEKQTVVVQPSEVKGRISEKITLPNAATVTENQLVPVQKKSGGKKWLAAAMVLVVAGASAFGVYKGYIPLPEQFRSNASTTDTTSMAAANLPTTDSTQNTDSLDSTDAAAGDTEKSGVFGGFADVFGDKQKDTADAQTDVVDLQPVDQNNTTESNLTDNTAVAALTGDEKSNDVNAQMPDISVPTSSGKTQQVASNQPIVTQAEGNQSGSVAVKTQQPVNTVDRTLAHVEHNTTNTIQPKIRKLDKGVAVLAFGDPAVANPIEKILESELRSKNIKILNEQFVPGVSSMLSDGADLAALRESIMNYGGSAMVIANVNYIGEQTLQYYGRNSQLISAQLDVDSYDLRSGDSIGSGYGTKLSYTSLNATEQAQEALMEFIDQFTGDMAKR